MVVIILFGNFDIGGKSCEIKLKINFHPLMDIFKGVFMILYNPRLRFSMLQIVPNGISIVSVSIKPMTLLKT